MTKAPMITLYQLTAFDADRPIVRSISKGVCLQIKASLQEIEPDQAYEILKFEEYVEIWDGIPVSPS